MPAGDPQSGNLGGSCLLGSPLIPIFGQVFAKTAIWFFSDRHCGGLDVTANFSTYGSAAWATGAFGGARASLGLRLLIFSPADNAWLFDGATLLLNGAWGPFSQGSVVFDHNVTQLEAKIDIHANRFYWIQAQTELTTFVIGGAAAGCDNVSTVLSSFHICAD